MVTGVLAVVDFGVGDENVPFLFFFIVIKLEDGATEEDIL